MSLTPLKSQQQQQQQAEPRHHHRRGTTNEIRHHSHGGLETIASPGAREGRYAQVDDEGRLHRVSEMDVRRLSREDRAGDGEADEREGDEYPFPYTPRRDGARGVRGRGEEYGDEEEDEEYDDEGGYTPRGYGGRGRSSRRA